MGFIQVLLQSQMNCARQQDPAVELAKIGRLGGISEDKFKSCLAHDKLRAGIAASRQAGDEAGVDSTPTFFFNGKQHAGELDYDSFLKLVQDAGS